MRARDCEDALNELDVDATARLGERIGGLRVVEEGTIAWNMKPLEPVRLWAVRLHVDDRGSETECVENVSLLFPGDYVKSTRISWCVGWSESLEIWRSGIPDMGNVRHSER